MVHRLMLWQYDLMLVLVTLYFLFYSSAEPSENLREILQNVAKPHGVSNMRKLGHLNNFIKVMLQAAMSLRKCVFFPVCCCLFAV